MWATLHPKQFLLKKKNKNGEYNLDAIYGTHGFIANFPSRFSLKVDLAVA